MNTIDTVKRIYEAFGRGDVPSILATLAEDVVWEYGTAPNGVPWLAPGRGHAHVGTFFATLASEVRFDAFAVNEVVGNERVVVSLVSAKLFVKKTGKLIVEENEAHLWHFDASGKIVRFRHAADTHGHWLALQP